MSLNRHLAPMMALLLLATVATAGSLPPELEYPPPDTRFGPEDLPPVLTWTAVTGAKGYELELGADPEFTLTSGPMPVGEPAYDMEQIIPGVLWGDWSFTLYWRVRTASPVAGPAAPWSDPGLFHKSALPAPGTISPPSGDRFCDGDDLPLFEWEELGGAASYQMEFDLTEEFDEPLGRIEIPEASLDLTGTGSEAWDGLTGLFYWRVAGLDAYGVPGPWGSAVWFAKSIEAGPTPLEPEADVVLEARSDPVAFRWLPLEDAVEYQLQIAGDQSFQYAGSVTTTDPELLVEELISAEDWWSVWGTIWWRVAATTDTGARTGWSPARRFTKLGLHRFMAWGDSITAGECVFDAYLDYIRPELRAIFPDAVIVNEGIPGAKSLAAEELMEDKIRAACPEYVFMLFGANDCVDDGNCYPPHDCDVDGHLGAAVDICHQFGVTPMLSTLVPINQLSHYAWAQYRATEWSQKIRALRTTHGVEVAETEQLWLAQPDQAGMYCPLTPPDYDWVHPSERGCQVLADAFLMVLDRVLE